MAQIGLWGRDRRPEKKLEHKTEKSGVRGIVFLTKWLSEWENPLIGWTSTGDPLSYVGEAGLLFDSVDATNAFAEKHGWGVHCMTTCGIRKGFGLALHASKIMDSTSLKSFFKSS
ncbi:hypothetical protein H5410_024240 [Solanum commersonii]|uniref:NADH dehydrogenase [ubiquinone] iron-sulfur protein 4, mitochondrial n=1 Tax=Solanum commersonii TaxID=4109 RepID=A0A9J5ZLF0_SOLCO|nr:hypothetical protein H5410_024240 [Solanum commersonii]